MFFRSLHHCRWFYNVTDSAAVQKKLLGGGVDRLLWRNKSLAAEGLPPMEFEDCVKTLKQFYSESGQGGPEHLLTSGDPYSGSRTKESSDYTMYMAGKRGAVAQQQSNRPNNSGAGTSNSGNQNRKSFNGGKQNNHPGGGNSSGRLLNSICRSWNEGKCSKPSNQCKYRHACNKMIKNVMKSGRVVHDWICQDGSHTAASCPK